VVNKSTIKKSSPANKKAAPKKKASVKKRAVKRKAPAKKRAPVKRKTPIKKASKAKKRASSRKSPSKADTLHKDGTEQFTTSDELLDAIPNYRGRPTKYTVTTINRICSYISMGYSLNKVCSYSDMPAISTVLEWLNDKTKEDFLDKYTRAREMRVEIIEDSMIDIADNAANPLMVKGKPVIIKGKPVMVTDNASVQHARLRIDTRTRHMEVVKPKKWGRDVDLGHSVGGLLELMDIAAGRLANHKEKQKQALLIVNESGEVVDE